MIVVCLMSEDNFILDEGPILYGFLSDPSLIDSSDIIVGLLGEEVNA